MSVHRRKRLMDQARRFWTELSPPGSALFVTIRLLLPDCLNLHVQPYTVGLCSLPPIFKLAAGCLMLTDWEASEVSLLPAILPQLFRKAVGVSHIYVCPVLFHQELYE